MSRSNGPAGYPPGVHPGHPHAQPGHQQAPQPHPQAGYAQPSQYGSTQGYPPAYPQTHPQTQPAPPTQSYDSYGQPYPPQTQQPPSNPQTGRPQQPPHQPQPNGYPAPQAPHGHPPAAGQYPTPPGQYTYPPQQPGYASAQRSFPAQTVPAPPPAPLQHPTVRPTRIQNQVPQHPVSPALAPQHRSGQPGIDAYGQYAGPGQNSAGFQPGSAPAPYVPASAPTGNMPDPRYGGFDTPATGRPQAPVSQPQHAAFEQWTSPTQPPRPPSQSWQPSLSAEPVTARPAGRPAAPHAYEPDLTPAYTPPATQGMPAEQHHEDYDDEDDDDAPRRPRYMLIAASLVMAIVAGGGLAYAYTAIFANPKQSASTPVVKNNASAARERPANPGGTKIAGAESKLMENLSGSSAADTGPKRVQTQTIRLDGSVAEGNGAPAATPQPPTASPVAIARANSATAMPGMMIDLPPRAPATTSALPQAAAPAAPAPAAPPPAAAPVKPTRLTAAAPPPAPVFEEPTVAPPKTQVKRPAPSGVGASTVGTGSGFVAVLASVPATANSKALALQQFADMRNKYGAALADKAPDVVEAQIPDKGTYHRLVVGPPASREAANGVCTQIKAAGYTGSCWVTAF